MVVVLSVVALLLAFLAMVAAARAWVAGDRGVRRPPPAGLARAVVVVASLDVVAGAVLGLSLVHAGGPPRTLSSAARSYAVGSVLAGHAPSRGGQARAGLRNAGLAGRGTGGAIGGSDAPANRRQSTGAHRQGTVTSSARTVRTSALRGSPPAANKAGLTSRERPGALSRPPAKVRVGPPPVLRALLPASGAPGQVVTLLGSGLFSPDGLITVIFGSAPAHVACPTQTRCRATVPPAPKRGSSSTVNVTLVTQSGASNKLAFTYG